VCAAKILDISAKVFFPCKCII